MAHKEIKKNITVILESTLGELKKLLGEKKFNNRLKKAVKLLTEGIEKDKKEASIVPQKKVETPVSALSQKKPEAKKKLTSPAVKKAIKAPIAKKATKAPIVKKAIKKAPVVKKNVVKAKK
jgi:citrate synthase